MLSKSLEAALRRIPELFPENISAEIDIPEDPVYELMCINDDHGYPVTRLKLLASAAYPSSVHKPEQHTSLTFF